MQEREKWFMYFKIQKYREMGLKIAQIARNLNVSRTTVYNYMNLTPEEVDKLQHKKRKKKLDKYEKIIVKWLKSYPDLSAAQIYDWLLERYNYLGTCETTVRNFVREIRENYSIPKETVIRDYEKIEDPPMGKQAQVDFGEKNFKDQYGKKIKQWFIAFVLSNSRFKYAEWLNIPFTTADTIKAHENAFKYFGGISEEIVYDQDKLILVSENYGDLILTKEFAAYQEQKGFKIHMTKKGDPESKGRVENVVGFVKRNFAKNRTFYSTERLNEECLDWLERTGNGKMHETTKKIPAEIHLVERHYLRPIKELNITTNCNSSITALIRKDNTILYASNHYSLPLGTYDGTEKYASLEIDGTTLIISDKETGQEITRHEIYYGKGGFIKKTSHKRDRTKSIEEFLETVKKLIGDNEKAEKLLLNIYREKPRYVRDQLQLVKEAVEQTNDVSAVKKALDYCLRYKLYSAPCFKDALKHFEVKKPVTVKPPDIEPLNKALVNNYKAKPQVRDLRVYQNVVLERSNEHRNFESQDERIKDK